MSAGSHLAHAYHPTFTTTIETLDHQDHTFNGIYFELSANSTSSLPVTHVVLTSLSVRGELGPMTVWTTPSGLDSESFRKLHDRSEWKLIFKADLPPSLGRPVPLKFDAPLVLEPGQKIGLYVHSARLYDDGIVYDNLRGFSSHTYKDDMVTIHSGFAHLSHIPFGTQAPWGGHAWRSNRAFVGGIGYGAKVLLWTTEVHARFPKRFRECCREMYMVQATSWDGLPAEVVLYVLNFCPADWFDVEEGGDAWAPRFLLKSKKAMRDGGNCYGGENGGDEGEQGGHWINNTRPHPPIESMVALHVGIILAGICTYLLFGRS